MFAAVGRNNMIVVHHAFSGQQLAILKGHVSAVTALSFSPNEKLLVSTGQSAGAAPPPRRLPHIKSHLSCVGSKHSPQLLCSFPQQQARACAHTCSHFTLVPCPTQPHLSPAPTHPALPGAGGAVYFWDLATGSRMGDAEYVDKRCMYASAAFAGGNPNRVGAVVRANDGRLQHIVGGKVEYEVAGPKGGEKACCALLGGDVVLLASDDKGGSGWCVWEGEQ